MTGKNHDLTSALLLPILAIAEHLYETNND